MKTFLVTVLALFLLAGCGIKNSGTRTVSFGPDGVTVESETVKLNAEALVDIEKEKTRQVCYKQKSKQDKSLTEAVKTNPIALAMWEQAKALNNALSFLATGKPYDPCPSSTNSSDVEIADSKMYTKIWGTAGSIVKFAIGAWAGTEIADSILGMGAGYSMAAVGEGSNINVYDSFKSSTFRDGATTGNIFSSQPGEVEVEVDTEDVGME